MSQVDELRTEADRILSTISPAICNGVRQLIPDALDEVQDAIREGSHERLVLWASKHGNQENASAALFVCCTAAIRLIEKWQPSAFAAVDRLLLSARHLVARNRRATGMPAMIA